MMYKLLYFQKNKNIIKHFLFRSVHQTSPNITSFFIFCFVLCTKHFVLHLFFFLFRSVHQTSLRSSFILFLVKSIILMFMYVKREEYAFFNWSISLSKSTRIATSKSSLSEMFCKKVFINISQNSQENTCARVSLF